MLLIEVELILNFLNIYYTRLDFYKAREQSLLTVGGVTAWAAGPSKLTLGFSWSINFSSNTGSVTQESILASDLADTLGTQS